MMMTDLEIIESLDFRTEEPPICELKIRRGMDHVPCGRLAEWVVTTLKECGHSKDTYLCNRCYERAIINAQPPYVWICDNLSSGSKCGVPYFPRDALINAERLRAS